MLPQSEPGVLVRVITEAALGRILNGVKVSSQVDAVEIADVVAAIGMAIGRSGHPRTYTAKTSCNAAAMAVAVECGGHWTSGAIQCSGAFGYEDPFFRIAVECERARDVAQAHIIARAMIIGPAQQQPATVQHQPA
jgi:hypothetical protein